MNALELGKKHFTERMSVIKSLVVPEWGGLEIFYKPSMTMKDTGKILKLHSEGELAEAIIMTLIIKALRKDGKKMYVPADRLVMSLQFCPDVISRVVTEMSDDEQFTAEDATKN